LAVPVVAIVGRPNVGKSSLFNWLAGKRIAIVEPTAGVTRDRVTALIEVGDRSFELIDTGGMGMRGGDHLTGQVKKQIETAIQQADLLIFVVDARSGLVPLDEEVAQSLRQAGKPFLCVVNKCDTPELDDHATDFFKLGGEQLVCVSAQQSRGKPDLLERILERLATPKKADETKGISLKLAIVGRRNTGKSTFINCLARAERMIVSEVPGTTRDSVDIRFEQDGKVLIAIDTAGVRRKGSIADSIEFYSLARAERSIRRADVVLVFLDPRVRISKVDKQLAGYILEQKKPAIFVVNKWDLMVPMTTGRFGDYIRGTFPSLDFVPIAFITAKDGKNVQKVLNLAQNLHKQAGARVSTGELNRILRFALEQQAPPLRQNRRAKVFYGTQVAIQPPTIVLFTNGPELFDNTYLRYLLKIFRDHLPFHDVPIKLYLRQRTPISRRGRGIRGEGEQPVKGTARDGEASSSRPARTRSARKEKSSRRRREPELWKDL
jgi:GTP-binding protein